MKASKSVSFLLLVCSSLKHKFLTNTRVCFESANLSLRQCVCVCVRVCCPASEQAVVLKLP